MKTFVQYLEDASKDKDNLRRLGLDPYGMRVIKRKPKEYSESDILESSYLYLNVPESDNESWSPQVLSIAQKLRPYNGHIVSRYTYNHSSRATGVWINLSTGRSEEGMSYRVPFDWLKPVQSKSGNEHGKWLDKTYFSRSGYVSSSQRKTDSWKYYQKIHLSSSNVDLVLAALSHLEATQDVNHRYMKELALRIRTENEDGQGFTVKNLFSMIDMLLDIGRDKEAASIREIVDSYISYISSV